MSLGRRSALRATARAAALALAACAPKIAQLQLPADLPATSTTATVAFTPYPVHGTTLLGVARSLRRRALDPTGHHAETSWDLGAAWDTRPTAAGCALASRRVYVAIRLTLPEWRAPAGAGSDLLGAWSAYSEALWTHERGHAARAMRAAEDLAATLDELPAAPSCLDVNRAARSRLVAAVSWLQTEQDIYDAATEHGATQGAQLPIPTRQAPRSVLSTPPAGTTRRASQAIHSAR